MKRRVWCLALGLACCTAPETRRAATPGPTGPLTGGPQAIDASDPSWPSWLREADRGRPSVEGFVGRAEAPTLEAARALAMRDLYTAVSSYLAIELSSEHDDHQHAGPNGEGQTVREVVVARSAARLEGVGTDAQYWEEIAASPQLLPTSHFRYFVRARLSTRQLEENRRQRAAHRQATTTRQLVVVLPFATTTGASPRLSILAQGLSQDLLEGLRLTPGVLVADPSSVSATLGDPQNLDEAALERVRATLLPDRMISGLLQEEGDRLRLTWVLRDEAGRALAVHTLDQTRRQASTLPEALLNVATRALGQRSSPAATPPAPTPVANQAQEAYYEALAAYGEGDNRRALLRIHEALKLRPEDGPAHLRLGRILERLGHYGRLPPSAAVLAQRAADLPLCSATAQAALQRAEVGLKARAARRQSGAPSLSPPLFLDVDAGLAQALEWPFGPSLAPAFAPDPGPAPPGAYCPGCGSAPPRTADQIDSALEAYLAAIRHFNTAGQTRGHAEALLAIAGLARRVDRLDYAYTFYRRVDGWARQAGAPDLAHEALAGQGMVLRALGNLPLARQQLEQALREAHVLADQPRLLELHNELGGLEVEAGRLTYATQHYQQAFRLASELGDEYLQAVLQNNLGVLELRQGRTQSAEERFERSRRFLENLGELEGQQASGLNVGLLAALQGRPERALAHYQSVAFQAERTGQEGWLAQVEEKRGALLAGQGDLTSLEPLGTAYLISKGLGRAEKAERLHNALLVAELERPERSTALLDCLKWRYWELGAPSFALDRDETVPTLATLTPEALTEAELITALNAAALSGLSAWRPPHLLVPTRPPAPHPNVLRAQWEQPHLPPRPHSVPWEVQPEPSTAAPGVDLQITSETTTETTRPSSAPPPPPTSAAISKKAAHDRILGAFTADAELWLMLDPSLLELGHHRSGAQQAVRMLAGGLRIAEAKAAPKAQAVALLNLAAYEWWAGRADTAYRLLLTSQRTFAELADVYGLAHTYEWMGWFFRESNDPQRAIEQFEIAERLYQQLGHGPAVTRVRGY
jgi:tetratricopeptide (TPR) repeat protein/TolB-like protein